MHRQPVSRKRDPGPNSCLSFTSSMDVPLITVRHSSQLVSTPGAMVQESSLQKSGLSSSNALQGS